MTNTGKKKSAAVSPMPAPKGNSLLRPNRNSVHLRPFNHKEMTKAEMQEDLRKAVENTK